MTTLQASLPNISRRAAWTRPIPTVLILSLLVVLAGCRGLPVPTFPAAGAFVASELASLAPEGRFDHSVVDFSQAEETSRGVSASGVGFESFTGNIGFGIGVAVAGGQAPPGGRFVGSTEHLRLTGAGSIRLTSPATVLGMYVALTHDEALRHRWIASGEDARLLVSGADRNGNRTGTVKVTPAIGTRDGTYVSEEWMWVDLSILGTVSELEVTFESPI